MFFPFPDKIFDDVTCIRPEFLRQAGIRGLLLDIDGTLAQTRQPEPSPAVDAWLAEMRRSGVALYILSNNRHRERVQAFAQAVDLPWQNLAGKPGKRGFCLAAERLGLPPGKLALVGDQIFTDMWGARRWGCKGILVESTDIHLWYFWLRRLLELPFRKERP